MCCDFYSGSSTSLVHSRCSGHDAMRTHTPAAWVIVSIVGGVELSTGWMMQHKEAPSGGEVNSEHYITYNPVSVEITE